MKILVECGNQCLGFFIGGLLQKVNRDTLKCAFKCSHAIVNGENVRREVLRSSISFCLLLEKHLQATHNRPWQRIQEGTVDT